MKILFLFILIFNISFSQDTIFPFKGKYIFYSYEEKAENVKHCLKYYLSSLDSLNQNNGSSTELMLSLKNKSRNLNSISKGKQVIFDVNPILTNWTGCVGEVKNANGLLITLPTGTQWLEENLLFSLLTVGKFKISSQSITATVKVSFTSRNTYNLSFSNFKITYGGIKGSEYITQELNLEDVYSNIKNNKGQNDKMYDKGIESMIEIDKIVKECAKIFSQEFKRIYEIDDL